MGLIKQQEGKKKNNVCCELRSLYVPFEEKVGYQTELSKFLAGSVQTNERAQHLMINTQQHENHTVSKTNLETHKG